MNNKAALNRVRIRFADESKSVFKAGAEVGFVVEAQIVSLISVRGVFAYLVGFEQVCWSSKPPDQSNAVRHPIIKTELLIHGDPERNESLPPGMHAFNGRFRLPENLPSSFTLDQQNAHTGVFYQIEAEFRTITRLRSAPHPLRVEALLHTVALDKDCRIKRSTQRSFLGAGRINVTVLLHRSILVAGDVLRFDVDIANGTQKHLAHIVVTLKQQLTLYGKANKRIDASERVFFVKDADVASTPPGSAYHKTLEFVIPPGLPQTQTTKGGSITIEYHINVALHVPWSSNIRVRLPLAILQKTSFPDLLAPTDAARIRRASFVEPTRVASPAPAADHQYAPPSSAAGAQYTPAPLHTTVYTPAPAKSRAGEPQPVAGYGATPGANAAPQPVAGYGSTPAPAPRASSSEGPREPLHGYGLAPSHKGALSPRVSRPEPAEFQSLYESTDGAGELGASTDDEATLSVASPALEPRRLSRPSFASEEDVAAYKRAETYFNHWDRDASGTIDRNEFRALHADLVKNGITALSFDDCWNDIDADGDGSLSFNEYVDFLIGVGSLRAPPEETESSARQSSFELDLYPYVMTREDQAMSARGLNK